MPLPNKEQSVGFIIRRLQQIAVSHFSNEFVPLGITPLQYTLLRIVREHPGADQTMIAKHAVLDRSTTTDVLVRLESKGMISRAPGSNDKRTRAVQLTKMGERLLEAAFPLVKKTRQALLAPLSQIEKEQLLASLEKLVRFHEEDRQQNGSPSPWRRLSATR